LEVLRKPNDMKQNRPAGANHIGSNATEIYVRNTGPAMTTGCISAAGYQEISEMQG
jgi:hypothetical protein